ncbi:UNVERIFIED_CONTAM: hypothetical protein FKN15_028793 [Acipenser sinensis]
MNPVLSLSQNNRISWIPSGAFSQQLHLRELYLQNNQLSDRGLQNDTFSKLRSLEYLDLSMNNLTRVPEGLPPGITILHLGKNRISSLSAEEVSRVRSLEYLLLQNNELTARDIHPQVSGAESSHTHMHARTHARTHAHTHTDTHTHTHTHTCPLLSSGACPSGKYSFLSTPQLRGVSLR